MTDKSRAWQMGYDAAKMASHRKPPKGASQKWQDEYWQGWHVGNEEAKAGAAAFKEYAKRLLGNEYKETTK